MGKLRQSGTSQPERLWEERFAAARAKYPPREPARWQQEPRFVENVVRTQPCGCADGEVIGILTLRLIVRESGTRVVVSASCTCLEAGTLVIDLPRGHEDEARHLWVALPEGTTGATLWAWGFLPFARVFED